MKEQLKKLKIIKLKGYKKDTRLVVNIGHKQKKVDVWHLGWSFPVADNPPIG